MSADARLSELALELPPAPEPKGVYRPLVVVDNLAYTSAHPRRSLMSVLILIRYWLWK